MKAVVAAAILVTTTSAGICDEQIPMPQHPISDCRKLSDKKSCLKESWKEYKQAILSEYKHWKNFEPVALSGDETQINIAFRTAMENGWYVHNHWEPIMPDGDEAEIISYDEAERIFACRTAIIDMKFWLVGLTTDGSRNAEDRASYRKSSKECEKTKR